MLRFARQGSRMENEPGKSEFSLHWNISKQAALSHDSHLLPF